jgi:hypothetical protein
VSDNVTLKIGNVTTLATRDDVRKLKAGAGYERSKKIMKHRFPKRMIRYTVTVFLIVAALWLIPLIFLFEK